MKVNKKDKSPDTDLFRVSENQVEFNQETVLRNTFGRSSKEGFELMFRYYYAPLCSNAIRVVYSREAAEDIVSEVFEDFWERRCDTAIRTTYKAYLYQAVRNKSLNYIQKSSNRHIETNDLNEEILNKGFQVTPEDIMNFHELTRNLERAIGVLPKQSRKAFQLHRLDGKRYSEIAEEMNITVSAVERLISRSLKKLREVFNHEGGFVILLLMLAS